MKVDGTNLNIKVDCIVINGVKYEKLYNADTNVVEFKRESDNRTYSDVSMINQIKSFINHKDAYVFVDGNTVNVRIPANYNADISKTIAYDPMIVRNTNRAKTSNIFNFDAD